MPQPHASTTIAAVSHHHSHSHASAAGNHPRPAPNYPPVFPPRSSSSTRTPPVGLAPARSESVPSVPYVHSTTPGTSSHSSNNNLHYNRSRSGTIDNPATTAFYNDGNYDDGVIKARVAADLRYFSSASRTRNSSIDRGAPPSRPPPVPSSPAYFAAALPRTSSLLPPPRGLGPVKVLTSTTPFPAFADVTPIAEDEPSQPPDSLTKPRRSRASSLGAASDGFRNLNRWSVSTTSSITSPLVERDQQPPPPPLPQQQPPPSPARPTNFSRRMSVDSIGLVNQASDYSPQSTYQSPRKLTKRRPSVVGPVPVFPRTTSAAGTRARQHSPPPPAAPPNLPPIISLPSLDLSTTPLTASFDRPSPSADTSSSALTSQPSNGGSKNHFWDEQADPNSTSAIANRANPPGLLPPANVTRDTTMGETNGHTRTRSSTKSSVDLGRSSRKQPSQKAMLSKALAKANTAVQLDNAHNYSGARTSYLEACELLRQVLARTTGEEDQKKLEAIVSLYPPGDRILFIHFIAFVLHIAHLLLPAPYLRE
jgi:hypothetical protein